MSGTVYNGDCTYCGGPILKNRSRKGIKFCSFDCYNEARAVKPRECLTCGDQFMPSKRHGRFCSISCSRKAERNPMWRGKEVDKEAARARARRLYSLDGIACEYQGCEELAKDRHHINGDTRNNDRSNIRFLCRRHHMVEDGRLDALMERNAA